MERSDMERVLELFSGAARRAEEAGFDFIEGHYFIPSPHKPVPDLTSVHKLNFG
jgi:hypothetical protein